MFDAYTSQILTFIGINSILALSLYITALAGQLSVGHAAFMGIGAYTSAMLMTKLGWPFFLSAPAGALVGGSSGFASACRPSGSRTSTWPLPRWPSTSSG